MNAPVVSVIIPVYNTEKYIEECLDSVARQKIDNLEIICIDDGSTDHSLDIMTEYARKDPRLIVLTQSNAGQSAARNKGLTYAKGQYVYFLDSDDCIDAELFGDLIPVMQSERLDILCFDGMNFFATEELQAEYGHFVEYSKRKHEYRDVVTGAKLFEQLWDNKDFQVAPVKQLYRRQFLRENQLQFFEGILHEDELFVFQALLKAERVSHRKKVYYLRRVRDGSIMTTPKSHRNFKGYYTCYAEMLRFVLLNDYGNLPHVWDNVARLRRAAMWVYSLLDDSERKMIDWTTDGFYHALIEKSEFSRIPKKKPS